MGVLRSLALAFACFSRIPVPNVDWNDANMRYLMACFPLVGVVVGVLVALWCWLSSALGFGAVLFAVGLVVMPVAVTGGIHLDGFADVVDAVSSHSDVERKRAILKDPHIGAFAVIGTAVYLLVYLGVATEAPRVWQVALLLACVHVVTRCLSGFATIVMKGASAGMLAAFRGAADRRCLVALLAECALAAIAMIAASWLPALVALAGAACCLVLLRPFARRHFGGMSGDVAGFFLQVCELVMVACIVFSAKAVGL